MEVRAVETDVATGILDEFGRTLGTGSGVAQVQVRSSFDVLWSQLVWKHVTRGPASGQEGPCPGAAIDQDDGAVGCFAGGHDGVRHVNALVAELRENFRSGGVIANARDEGRISAEPGNGDHGRGDHPPALLGPALDGCASLWRRNLGQQEEIIDAREAKSEDAGTALGFGWVRGSVSRGHNGPSYRVVGMMGPAPGTSCTMGHGVRAG